MILDVVWCPRTDQSVQLCDNSCKSDTDEFTLPDNVHSKILKTLNVEVSMNLFASTALHRCKLFYTKKPSLGSSGADALKFDWSSKETMFCFPPKNLLFKVFSKIELTELTRLAAKLVEGKYHLLLHLYESSTPCVTVTYKELVLEVKAPNFEIEEMCLSSILQK